MMEVHLIQFVFQSLLKNHFRTKRNMASMLHVSYSKLVRVWTTDHLTAGTVEAMDGLLFYCAKHNIRLDDVMQDYSTIAI